jgi:hypothetical protein
MNHILFVYGCNQGRTHAWPYCEIGGFLLHMLKSQLAQLAQHALLYPPSTAPGAAFSRLREAGCEVQLVTMHLAYRHWASAPRCQAPELGDSRETLGPAQPIGYARMIRLHHRPQPVPVPTPLHSAASPTTVVSQLRGPGSRRALRGIAPQAAVGGPAASPAMLHGTSSTPGGSFGSSGNVAVDSSTSGQAVVSQGIHPPAGTSARPALIAAVAHSSPTVSSLCSSGGSGSSSLQSDERLQQLGQVVAAAAQQQCLPAEAAAPSSPGATAAGPAAQQQWQEQQQWRPTSTSGASVAVGEGVLSSEDEHPPEIGLIPDVGLDRLASGKAGGGSSTSKASKSRLPPDPGPGERPPYPWGSGIRWQLKSGGSCLVPFNSLAAALGSCMPCVGLVCLRELGSGGHKGGCIGLPTSCNILEAVLL